MTDKEKLIKQLFEAKKAYHESGRSTLSDQEYDALEDLLRKQDPDHPFFEIIGHPPSDLWKSASHKIRMGSLNKVHSAEDFVKWASKYPEERLILQPKLDGLSLSIEYDNSVFVRAITRGDGLEGEEISDNVQLMKNFQEKLFITAEPFTGAIRCEILLSKENFQQINNTLSEKDRYSNPRNAAAGISRKLDGKFCRYLELIAYNITETLNEDQKIERLEKLGLKTVQVHVGDVKAIIKAYEHIKSSREQYPINLDGVVVKVCSYETQQKMGWVKNKPRAQMAWKFDPPGAVTTFLEETWDVGRTGVITPLAHLEPVEIDGSIVSKATLHNIAEIERLGIGRGDKIMLVKAGDIIPKVTSVLEHKGQPIQIPTKCPSCGSELLNDKIRLFCPSDDCPRKQFNRILNWIKVMKIDQFGEALAARLNDLGKLNSILCLYKLEEKDISTLEGWGESSADKILDSINQSRQVLPEVFLTAVGIPGISEGTSEDLIKAYGSIEKLFDITPDELKQLKGFSDISANTVVEGFKKYGPEIRDLLKIISLSAAKDNSQGILSGQSFCFTGAMAQPRSYYQALVTKNGGKNSSTVNKDLSFLVCNENKGSSKSVKAEKFGVKVISEFDFMKKIGETIPEQKPDKTLNTFSIFE